jgi:hypothetical protein
VVSPVFAGADSNHENFLFEIEIVIVVAEIISAEATMPAKKTNFIVKVIPLRLRALKQNNF